MRYLSVCSGIEAATVAWHHMDWEAAGFSEIEKFPSLVLDHHYPNVPKLGDMTRYKEWDIGTIDLLVGGTPCQSFSVAGLRKGMADPRGNLALTFLAIADHYKPQWIVWENVPGVLSSNKGKDFESFLDGLEELGYILDCDILDAQFHGVAQRRRRVFVCAQHRDYLLKNKTNSSALTIAQCWQEILLSLLVKAWSGLGKGQASLDLPYLSNDGAMRRMRLFGLDGETDSYETLLENLVEAFRRPPHEPSDWVATLGKLEKEPMQADLWKDSSTEDLFTLTEQSLREALGESYEVMKSCITSTPTSSITISQIYTCFKASLLIAKLIQRLNPSSPPFWSAATSALTTLREYTSYARQASNQLFQQVDGIQDWLYLIEQAERTEESLGSIAVECFGKVFPVSQSLRRDLAPSREAGQKVAPTVVQGPPYSRTGNERVECDAIVPVADPAYCLETTCNDYSRADGFNMVAAPIAAYAIQGSMIGRSDSAGPQGDGINEDVCFTQNTTDRHAVAYGIRTANTSSNGWGIQEEVTHTLDTAQGMAVAQAMAVRRLTPTECERLQGFPDGYTDIQPNGKPTPDGPRYKALGNSMAVPVMRWIGERIAQVDAL